MVRFRALDLSLYLVTLNPALKYYNIQSAGILLPGVLVPVLCPNSIQQMVLALGNAGHKTEALMVPDRCCPAGENWKTRVSLDIGWLASGKYRAVTACGGLGMGRGTGMACHIAIH